jgi:glycosyltransferase involved in cell wall biosynthesis
LGRNSNWFCLNLDEISKMIQQLNPDVSYIRYVPERDLGKIYNLASLFVCPSLYEGFGLPPLEAMPCGSPVVVSNIARLPDVYGNAAIYVDSGNASGIATGIEGILAAPLMRQSVTQKGLERGKLFTWEKSSRKHLQVLKEVSRIPSV